MPKLSSRYLLFAALLGVATGAALWLPPRAGLAQAGEAELSGEVRDPVGALVPNANVVATEQRTNQSFSTRSSSAGIYSLLHLPPGHYILAVESPGFKVYKREGIELSTGERARIDLTLTLGNLSQSVTVKATTPLLETESADLGQVIHREKLIKLPLDGRNFVSLVALAPGTALPPGSNFPRLSGGRPLVNEYLYDGVSVLQPEPGSVPFFPVVDAIQEFEVKNSVPPAEFGRFNGGVVNLTTMSGTNRFHGTAFEFLRNEALNARNLFAPPDSSRPLFRRNQFGGVLGGPLKRDKTFFFADFQATRQLIGRVRVSTVPTLLERQGVFTEAVGKTVPKIYDPATTEKTPTGDFTRQPFPDNIIPASRMDPVAARVLAHYPVPNSPGTANNYRRVGNESESQKQFDARLDQRLSEGNLFFARYSYARDTTDPVTPLPDGSGVLTSGALGLTHTMGQALASRWVRAFAPGATNELRVGYSARSINRRAGLLASPASNALGLPGISANAAFENALPDFVIDGYQQLGPPSSANSTFRTDVTEVADVFAVQRGRHLVKFGPDFRWERLEALQPPAPAGMFHFSALFTDLPGVPGTGFSMASFLLGQVQNFSIDLQKRVLRPRAHIQEYFIEDEWKVTRRLSVNAGLRYTLNFPSTEADNQAAVFNLATERLDFLGRSGFPRSARRLHTLDFGPRLGLAYQATERTVLRSAYGVIWIEQAGITTPFTTPFFPFLQTVSTRTLDNIRPPFVLSAGLSVAPIPLTPDAGLGQGVFAVDRKLGSGYAQQWNFSIQREITRNVLLEVAYVGSKITHIGMPDTNINQLTTQQLRQGTALLESVANPFFGEIPPSSSLGGPTLSRAQLLRPFPRFTTVSLYRNNDGNSTYHALQVKLEQRLSGGLSYLVAYTRSKLIDEASSVFNVAVSSGPIANFPVADTFNRKLERDVSNGDVPDNLVASFSYEVPRVRARWMNPRGVAGKFLGGWEVAGIVHLQSGLPLAVTQATNFNTFAGFGTQRPNRVARTGLPASRRSTAQWFNVSAFQVAPIFTLGNSSRNPVRGPSYRNADLALIKHTPIGEQFNLDFRAEFFNLSNTPPLGAPNTLLGTPGFGSITSASDPRVIQLALKLNF